MHSNMRWKTRRTEFHIDDKAQSQTPTPFICPTKGEQKCPHMQVAGNESDRAQSCVESHQDQPSSPPP